mmetsp:Transcript_52772/g.115750  ORF Transcript_52772/g.115750 Transcript_52772/m.115750 type:complete len:224 (-) Transcript_52772:237-908(-)
MNPTTSARSFVREDLRWHIIVGRLHSHADVRHIRLFLHAISNPVLLLLGVVLDPVFLLDAHSIHGLGTIISSSLGERAKTIWEKVNNVKLQSGKEVAQLCGPLDTNESCSCNQNCGSLVVETFQLVVLFDNVSSSALDEPLIQVRPLRHFTADLVHGGKPQGFPLRSQKIEIASRADQTIVKRQGLQRATRGEHGLDLGGHIVAIKLLHFTPKKFHVQLSLQH